MSGALLRVTSMKVYLRVLKEKDTDNRVKQLLYALIRIYELQSIIVHLSLSSGLMMLFGYTTSFVVTLQIQKY